jgi:hypothetical protein
MYLRLDIDTAGGNVIFGVILTVSGEQPLYSLGTVITGLEDTETE